MLFINRTMRFKLPNQSSKSPNRNSSATQHSFYPSTVARLLLLLMVLSTDLEYTRKRTTFLINSSMSMLSRNACVNFAKLKLVLKRQGKNKLVAPRQMLSMQPSHLAV